MGADVVEHATPAMDDEAFFRDAAALVIVEDDVQQRLFDAFVEASNHPLEERALERAIKTFGDPALRAARAAQLRLTEDAA